MMIPYIITLRKVDTGEEFDYLDEWPDFDRYGDPWDPVYYWTEGNNSCDCNRALFYFQWKNNLTKWDWPEDRAEMPCGDERFKLVSIWNMKTGEHLTIDKEYL